jgi:hypothetical protein
MQTVTCEILLSGDIGNTVVKEGITVPEIVILTALHGVGSIRNVKLEGDAAIGNLKEVERLTAAYGKDIIAKAFPGSNPNLPKKLVDIGIEDAPVAELKK